MRHHHSCGGDHGDTVQQEALQLGPHKEGEFIAVSLPDISNIYLLVNECRQVAFLMQQVGLVQSFAMSTTNAILIVCPALPACWQVF